MPVWLECGYRFGDICLCKTLILYADKYIVDKKEKRDITFGVCVGIIIATYILFLLLCESLCTYA